VDRALTSHQAVAQPAPKEAALALIQGIPGEFGPQPWGEAIQRNCELLLLRITRRPPDHEVRLPGLATTPRHVVEDRTGRALTWRRDGDDLLVRLPDSGEPPVVRVALQGKLRIVPPDTVTANADGVWDLTPSGTTSHLVARRAADVAVRVFGGVGRVHLASQSSVVPDPQRTVGPFQMPAGRVVPLTVQPATVQPATVQPATVQPATVRSATVQSAAVRRILVAPVGTVLASLHPAGAGQWQVLVTNFGRAPARGRAHLPLPPGWSASHCRWSFDDLAPGASVGWTTQLSGPPGEHELEIRLDAGRRSASSPYPVFV
jgi:hypothetical protein